MSRKYFSSVKMESRRKTQGFFTNLRRRQQTTRGEKDRKKVGGRGE
jgi:hypothetical protein